MNELQQDPIDATPLTAGKAEWKRPEVDRLIAGGAEAGGDTSSDGVDTLS